MVEVSKQEIEKLAKISSIALGESEVSKFQGDLTNILNYVGQLKKVDVAGVEPTYQVVNLTNVWREDEVTESPVTREELLALAPENKGGAIKVPKVL